MGFSLYLLLTVSWFVHLTARAPALGAIRFDLVLISVIFVASFLSRSRQNRITEDNGTGRVLEVLCLYIVITIPLVQWPGSALFTGLPNFIKAIIFYYFTVSLVTTERKLKIFIAVFIACQAFRVFEPVYLHITDGYWGSFASMSNWEFMDRLSGAPHDTVNPNGLAFIIDTVMVFLYFLGLASWKWAIPALISFPVYIYALLLTGSRSGFICMLAIMIGIIVKSRKRAVVTALFSCALVVVFLSLNAYQKDRYLSILYTDTKNAVTAEGRIQGVVNDLRVALRKPIFGHGIGTSREANANFGGVDRPAHNLYVEITQELGTVGLVIFILYIRSIIISTGRSARTLNRGWMTGSHLARIGDAIQVWLFMNIIFSLASYGLSGYEWYLLGGLSVALNRLICYDPTADAETVLMSDCLYTAVEK